MAKFKGFGKAPKDKKSTAKAISEAFTIALEHYQAGRLVQVEQICRQILQRQPKQLEALHWLGSIAYQSGRIEEACSYCQKALTLEPNNLEFLNNLGNMLQEMGKQEAAIFNFQKALALNPNYALAHHGLGVTFIQQGKLEQAVTHLRQAIALNPNDAKAYCSLGVALQEQGLLEEALSIYQKAIHLQPDIPEAHINRGQIQLLLGDFHNGFAELEWRWRSKDWGNPRLFSQPLWDGTTLKGKTILLHTEQGLGDTIQFIRYAPLVAACGGRVVVECPAALRRLLSTVVGIEQLVVRGETLPGFQVHSPLLSLPHILGTILETIPAQIPYLSPPASHHLKLETLPDTIKVGIVWASGYRTPNFLRDYQRKSCPLSTYAQLFSIPGTSFYSLQVGGHAADMTPLKGEHRLQDLSPQIKDFADTAALVAQMDLVISVDTAVAHLAGAMGKPVWLLLSSPHDWRWLLEREDSPWYPSMRLFRQSQPGDWEGVIEQVAQALTCFCQEVQAEQKYRYPQQQSQFEALYQLGIISYQSGRLEEAARYLQKAVALDSNKAEVFSNLGSVLQETGEQEAAILNFQKALALDPNYAFAHHGLGVSFLQQGKLEQAVTYLRRAIALNPNDAKAYCSLGVALWEQGLFEEVLSVYQKAIQLQPEIPEAHINLGYILLLLGDFRNGFAEFEWRWLSKDRQGPRPFSQPLWDGSNLEGKTILLHAEQGLGDTLQFIRYAPLVAAHGGRVVVECPLSLRRLLSTVSGVEQLVVRGETLPEFQVHSPLLSLPHILGTTLETIPAQIPYLFSPASYNPRLMLASGTHFKVGIVWASGYREGNHNFLKDHLQKSCSLSRYTRLLLIPGMSFYSLQVGRNAADIALEGEHRIQDLSPQIKDFADTAALIAQMDLVISVDTAIAHLAGAMGKPVWLLLSCSHDWRWLVKREDSPWYPTMRLFRQSQPGDWEGVLEQVAQALSRFHQKHRHVGDGHQKNENLAPPAYFQQGVVAHQSGKLEEAAHYFQKAVVLHPDSAEAYSSLGSVLQEMGELEAAILSFEKALTLNPNYAFAHHGLGFTFTQQEKLEQAVIHLRRAIALAPNDAKAYCNLGVALWEQGLFEEAIFSYRKAIQIQPNIAEAHNNLAYILLLLGDFRNGFTEFEWRWQSKDWGGSRPFSQPLWDGSNLEGITILLHAEQGLGDTIQFIRYALLVAARGGRVVVGCPASLKRLLATVSSIEQLVVQGEPLPEFQVHAPLMSLPHILGTTLETIPSEIPYLFPPTSYHLKLEPLPGTTRKVGIVWASGYEQENRNVLKDYQRRSCPLSSYAQLLSISEISFYSLQVGRHASDITQLKGEYRLQDLSPQIKDFADTAAFVAQMDLVISVDTAVAHLAGALGKPVWVLLPFLHDWRWLLKREDSPWYPSMRLFRQSQPGDWEGVLAQVAQTLRGFCLQEVQTPNSRLQTSDFGLPKPASTETNHLQLPPATSEALAIALENYQVGQLAQAEQMYRQILQRQPDQLEALHWLGIIAQQSGLLEEASGYFQKVLILNPNNPGVLTNFASVLQEMGEMEAAILNLQKALTLDPNCAFAHYGMGFTLTQQEKLEQAVIHLRRAIALAPNDAKAYCSLVVALQEQGLIEEAISSYQKAIQLQTDMAEAHNNLSQILLLLGDFRNGFAEYEWRWQLKDWGGSRPFSQPLWDGSNLEGTTILLHAEQGLGDTIQFIRYAPLVAARGGRVVVGCPESLRRLLAGAPGIEQLVVQGNPLPEFQVHAPLMSLPHILGTTLETIPAQIPYLFPPTSYHLNLEPLPDTIKVGIVWASGYKKESRNFLKDYQRRSCPLSKYARLFSIPGMSFYSLQVGHNAADIAQFEGECRLQDLSPQIKDFADTAAFVAQMDLVISVDTAVAHLAGALGKPVWVLLPFLHDWRWLLKREDSPWYPTMRLFRQSQPGDWEGVLEQVAQALSRFHQKRCYAGDAHQKNENLLPPAYFQQGVVAHQSGRLEEAAHHFQKALALNPNNAEIFTNLGVVWQEMGKPKAAILNLQKALTLNPNYALAHHCLGFTLIQQGNLEQAVTHLRRAIALNPKDAKAYDNLGVALWEQGLFEEAVSSYQKAIQLQPNIAETHVNLSFVLLLLGDFRNGFAELEWYWQSQDRENRLLFSQPLWDGSRLEGKTILLRTEQGLGDTIQFIRYVPLVAARGGRVVVECPASLKRLLTTVPGIEHLVVQGETLPEFHVHSRLMSLPLVLETTLETIPAQIPYLFPPASHHLRLETPPGIIKVGVVWASGYKTENLNFLRDYRRRSCPLSSYTRLFSIPGMSFYSLQVGHNAADVAQLEGEHRLQDLSPHIKDVTDTAALIAQMDLVISVDTAVAHLAGSLGKPVWVLLSFPHDWRWLLDREDSPWYPTMRLFRQSQPGDWEDVLEQVAQALSRFHQEVSRHAGSRQQTNENLSPPAYFQNEQSTAPSVGSQFETLHQLGVIAYQLGNFEEATAYFQQAVALTPDDPQAQNNLSVVLMAQGKLAEAAIHLQQLIALTPNDVMAHINLGNVLREQGEPEAAILQFQIALALNSSNAYAYNGLGITLGNQNQWEEAIAYLRQAVNFNPDYADAHNNLGLVLQEVGKLEEAASHYQKAITLQPDNPIAYTNLGNLLHEQGQLETAILNFQKALALNPNDVDAHNSLNTVMQELGNIDQ